MPLFRLKLSETPAPRYRSARQWLGVRRAFSAARWTALLVAVPGMTLLIALLVGWVTPALLILGGLLTVQWPLFWACNLLHSNHQHGNG
jgi:hypothetical protein